MSFHLLMLLLALPLLHAISFSISFFCINLRAKTVVSYKYQTSYNFNFTNMTFVSACCNANESDINLWTAQLELGLQCEDQIIKRFVNKPTD